MPADALDRLRAICLALPGAVEVPAWGTATFRCPRIFAMYAQPSDEKHSRGRPGVWLKAAPGNQAFMVRDRPDRFYVPPYVGPAGWIGVYLDRQAPWGEVALLVEDAWRLLAPKRTVAAFDAGDATAPRTPASRKPTSRTPAPGKAARKPAARRAARKK